MSVPEIDEGRVRRFKFALSLARKAGKALCGTSIVCDGIRAGGVKFVIISKSASDNSKKRVINCATHYNTRILYTELTPETLGSSVGKSSLACVGITDENLAFNVERNLY